MTTSRRRSVLGLIGSWVAYWAILAAVKLGPAALAIYRVNQGPRDNTSDISFNVGKDGISVLITDHAVATWSGSIHLAPLALWIAGVPLALTFAWVYAQRAARTIDAAERLRA